jgi:hypothetical protein
LLLITSQVKVKYLLLIKHHSMMTYEGMEMHVHAFTLATLHPSEEKRMCPRAGQGVVQKRKMSAALQN